MTRRYTRPAKSNSSCGQMMAATPGSGAGASESGDGGRAARWQTAANRGCRTRSVLRGPHRGQALGGIGRPERFGQLVNRAFQHLRQVVGGEADAVVGDARLREVVGADLGAAVAGRDLRLPLGRVLGLGL